MFVEDYTSGRDVWTRALPALAVVVVISMLATLVVVSGTWSLVAFVVSAVIGAAAYASWNRRHGRVPWALPTHVTLAWIAGFVLLAPVAALLVTRDLEQFLLAVGGELVVVGAIYLITRYALLALIAWTIRWTFGQLGDVTRLITRVLPLMLLFITFLFINTEVWQVAGTMQAAVLWGSLAVFGFLGVLFIRGRSREEFDRIELGTDRAGVIRATVGTPMEAHTEELAELERPVPMRARQRGNLLLVMVTAQLVQVALVGAVVWAFFVVFGTVAISVPVQEAWLGSLAPVESVVTIFEGHALTRQLLRVATFLGGFAAFYATVYAASDQVYRAHFVERISTDLARAIAVRRAYLAARRRHGLGDPDLDARTPPAPAV